MKPCYWQIKVAVQSKDHKRSPVLSPGHETGQIKMELCFTTLLLVFMRCMVYYYEIKMELQLPVVVDCPFFFSGVLDLSLTDFGDSDIFAREG